MPLRVLVRREGVGHIYWPPSAKTDLDVRGKGGDKTQIDESLGDAVSLWQSAYGWRFSIIVIGSKDG